MNVIIWCEVQKDVTNTKYVLCIFFYLSLNSLLSHLMPLKNILMKTRSEEKRKIIHQCNQCCDSEDQDSSRDISKLIYYCNQCWDSEVKQSPNHSHTMSLNVEARIARLHSHFRCESRTSIYAPSPNMRTPTDNFFLLVRFRSTSFILITLCLNNHSNMDNKN